MLERVGFFHFGKGHHDPIGSVQKAMSEYDEEELRNSLVVLPEGFNLGRLYKGHGPASRDPAVLCQLRSLAQMSGITFVAGLIIRRNCDPEPPFNSAYLIDGRDWRLMCHKKGDDKTSDEDTNRNYTPCSDAYDRCNPCNPTEIEGAWVAALICIDSDHAWRPAELVRKIEESDCQHRIVCIPAFNRIWPKYRRGDDFLRENSNFLAGSNRVSHATCIRANSAPDPAGCNSIVTNGQGIVTKVFPEPDESGDQNKICLQPLDDVG